MKLGIKIITSKMASKPYIPILPNVFPRNPKTIPIIAKSQSPKVDPEKPRELIIGNISAGRRVSKTPLTKLLIIVPLKPPVLLARTPTPAPTKNTPSPNKMTGKPNAGHKNIMTRDPIVEAIKPINTAFGAYG